MTINYRTAVINGTKIFYREAGRPDAPALRLLHENVSQSTGMRAAA